MKRKMTNEKEENLKKEFKITKKKSKTKKKSREIPIIPRD
jgi:hypothetical protein